MSSPAKYLLDWLTQSICPECSSYEITHDPETGELYCDACDFHAPPVEFDRISQMNLDEQLTNLHTAREMYAARKQEYKIQVDRALHGLLHLKTEMDAAKEAVDVATVNIKRGCIQEYNVSKQTKFTRGVHIKIFSVAEYNEDDAIAWAIKSYMTGALKLDKKTFEKVAQAADLDFVMYRDDPRCHIPTKIAPESEDVHTEE